MVLGFGFVELWVFVGDNGVFWLFWVVGGDNG